MKILPSRVHFAACMLIVWPLTVHAGRPLSVDDANLNEPGSGHVEAWYARMPGKANTWNLAPAYAPAKDLELSALLSRDATQHQTTSAIQAKWRITASQPDGCNLGMVLGLSHSNKGEGNMPYVNGLATCNHKGGAVHANLGLSHPHDGTTLTNWGVAYERELPGGVTGHVEHFGQENGKPITQLGLRKDIAPGLQLDGTVGRSDGDVVFSLGMKKSF